MKGWNWLCMRTLSGWPQKKENTLHIFIVVLQYLKTIASSCCCSWTNINFIFNMFSVKWSEWKLNVVKSNVVANIPSVHYYPLGRSCLPSKHRISHSLNQLFQIDANKIQCVLRNSWSNSNSNRAHHPPQQQKRINWKEMKWNNFAFIQIIITVINRGLVSFIKILSLNRKWSPL